GSVRRRIGEHRANHTQVVGEPGRVREQTADLNPALATLLELEGGFHQVPDRAPVRTYLRVALVRCAVEFLQGGLRIERIYLARRAVHKQEDAVLRLGWKVRCFRSQRRSRRSRSGLEKSARGQQIDKGQSCEPAACLPQEFTAR